MITSKHLAVLITTFIALGTVSYAQSDQLKVGKTGQIALEQDTMIGNTLLPAGSYEARHRRSANGHFVEFTHVVENYVGPQESLSPYDWVVVAEVPCTMQLLNAPVTRTSMAISKGTVPHLDSLSIRGENVVHIFLAGPDPSTPQNQVEYGGPGM